MSWIVLALSGAMEAIWGTALGKSEPDAAAPVRASLGEGSSSGDGRGARLARMGRRTPRDLWVPMAALAVAVVSAGCGDGAGDPPEDGGDVAAFCAEARGYKDDAQRLADDPERKTPAERFTAMEAVAPPAIRDDVEAIRALWADAEENDVAIVIGGADAAENIRPYRELMERHPNARDAGPRFNAYVGEACGFFF